jgi:hypothetical protein
VCIVYIIYISLFTDLFPQLDHQKRVIAKSLKMQQWPNKQKSKGKFIKTNDKSDDSDSSQSRRRSHSKERNPLKKREI